MQEGQNESLMEGMFSRNINDLRSHRVGGREEAFGYVAGCAMSPSPPTLAPAKC